MYSIANTSDLDFLKDYKSLMKQASNERQRLEVQADVKSVCKYYPWPLNRSIQGGLVHSKAIA